MRQHHPNHHQHHPGPGGRPGWQGIGDNHPWRQSDDDGPGGGGRGRGRGPGGGRVRRGEARFVLLDALRESPKHGYEIIRSLDERSSGQYVPSPGMVYPTLQFLEDAGLVASDPGGERRVYQITDAGRTELETHAAELEAFWKQVAGPAFSPAGMTEVRFLREELEHLRQTVRSGVQPALTREDLATVKAVRLAIERCRNEVRDILSAAETKEMTAEVAL